ncbi:MAG: 5-oxoprolinase [Acidiferrobacteraceae bacterium]|nr:5-oxoprolinase [Acidiferrobacteraceae bacterium]|tara:strand:- start:959 stop:3004 length:2046 start_codon:yes stop_codon:yes gene_type:complete
MNNDRNNKNVRVAIDIGGTFTDAVATTTDGTVFTAKSSTTPGNLTDGVIDAIEGLDVDLKQVTSFIHGTTAGLNALLERRGAKVALLTTMGFRDIYEIGRANRPDLYNARYKRPIPLVRRNDIHQISERIAADGSVIDPVNEQELIACCKNTLSNKYDAIAVCLLHAYRNASHEHTVQEILSAHLPGIPVILSSQVAPEWREYERTSTTVVSAYVAPIVGEYLSRLEERLREKGMSAPVLVMQSNGGVVSASIAKTLPVQTLLSGPVGGATAGVAINNVLGDVSPDGLICVDMGGTSFDVSMVVKGEAQIELESSIDGHDLLFPAVAIHTVGAGGGSVAEVSAGGLHVGPRSAGAIPGPASYGRGGTEPTVTDANLVLGRISADAKLGGDMPLELNTAQRSMQNISNKLDLETTTLAEGIVKIADSNMANAIRELTVFRGIDPRDHALMAFGGAGPLHAVALAEELEISTVIVPAYAGVLSAWGMLQADYRVDRSTSCSGILGALDSDLVSTFAEELTIDAKATIAIDNSRSVDYQLRVAADLRYVGQEYTLTVVAPNFDDHWQEELRQDFDSAYQIRFGHCNKDEDVEIVNLRITLTVNNDPIPEKLDELIDFCTPISEGQSWSGSDWLNTPVYSREQLAHDQLIDGPSMVLESEATTFVPKGWQLQMHKQGHLLITKIG